MFKADEFIKDLEAKAAEHGICAQHIVVEAQVARTTYDAIKYGKADPTRTLRKIKAAQERLIARKLSGGSA